MTSIGSCCLHRAAKEAAERAVAEALKQFHVPQVEYLEHRASGDLHELQHAVSGDRPPQGGRQRPSVHQAPAGDPLSAR